LSDRRDFWLSCGHHLLDPSRDGGGLQLTDEFLKAYLARPEMVPPPDACERERELHQTLLVSPRMPILPARIAAIRDSEARENWEVMISWRDHLLRHATLEAAYLAIVRHGLVFPPMFLNQLVQVILRNMLEDCDDAFVLRAAEMFFRPQKLAVHQGSLLASDEESALRLHSQPMSPLISLLGLHSPAEIDVLSEANSDTYWERSDSFDLALDLTAGRRGLTALGEVVSRWVRHLLGVQVEIEAVTELRDVTLTWYVGLDSNATEIGDALWNGEELDDAVRELVVGIYRLVFADDAEVIEPVRGAPTFLLAASSADNLLRLKPQNLITGLPVLPSVGVPS
jgi:uncharacterized protein DUF6352